MFVNLRGFAGLKWRVSVLIQSEVKLQDRFALPDSMVHV